MNNTLVRLIVVIAAIVAVQLGFKAIGASTELPEVLDPKVPLGEFPMKLSLWEGENADLDSRTFARTEAASAVSRNYRNAKTNVAIGTLIAAYKTMSALYHSPVECYRSNGWTEKRSETVTLPEAGGRPEIAVQMIDYEHHGNGKKVTVLFWYELGDRVMYTRKDRLAAQWALRGRKAWPPIFKVLLQTDQTEDSEVSRSSLLEFAGEIRAKLGTLIPADSQ